MDLVVHSDSELHQMIVKTIVLNGELSEQVYMSQLKGFEENRNDNLVCKLK